MKTSGMVSITTECHYFDFYSMGSNQNSIFDFYSMGSKQNMLLSFYHSRHTEKYLKLPSSEMDKNTDEFVSFNLHLGEGHYLTKRSSLCFKVKADAHFNFHVESILHLLQSTTQYNYQLTTLKLFLINTLKRENIKNNLTKVNKILTLVSSLPRVLVILSNVDDPNSKDAILFRLVSIWC